MRKTSDDQANRRAMALSVAAGAAMLVVKVGAYALTGSSAILSDAVEAVIHLRRSGSRPSACGSARVRPTRGSPRLRAHQLLLGRLRGRPHRARRGDHHRGRCRSLDLRCRDRAPRGRHSARGRRRRRQRRSRVASPPRRPPDRVAHPRSQRSSRPDGRVDEPRRRRRFGPGPRHGGRPSTRWWRSLWRSTSSGREDAWSADRSAGSSTTPIRTLSTGFPTPLTACAGT